MKLEKISFKLQMKIKRILKKNFLFIMLIPLSVFFQIDVIAADITLSISDQSSSTELYALSVGPIRLAMPDTSSVLTQTYNLPPGTYSGYIQALGDDDDDGDYDASVSGENIIIIDPHKYLSSTPGANTQDTGFNAGKRYFTVKVLKKTINNDSKVAYTTDPINTISGNMLLSATDIVVPDTTLPLNLSRTYNSKSDYSGSLGYGWSHSFDWLLTATNVMSGTETVGEFRKLHTGNGMEYWFEKSDNGHYYSMEIDNPYELTGCYDGKYILTRANKSTWRKIYGQDTELIVHITPVEAVSTGAQWRVQGGAWQDSGDSLSLTAGTYTVEMSNVAGWLAGQYEVEVSPNMSVQISIEAFKVWKESYGINSLNLDSSNILYACNPELDEIYRYNPASNQWVTWGGSGSGVGEFNQPAGSAVDSSGNVYIADFLNRRIQVRDNQTGTWSIHSDWNNGIWKPRDICIPPDDSHYTLATATNAVTPSLNKAFRHNTNGTWDTLVYPGSANGQIQTAGSITIDADTNMYINDSTTDGNWHFYQRIQKFDKDGNFIAVVGSYETDNGDFDYIWDLSITPDNKLLVVDNGNKRLMIRSNTTGAWSQFMSFPFRPKSAVQTTDNILYVTVNANDYSTSYLLRIPLVTEKSISTVRYLFENDHLSKIIDPWNNTLTFSYTNTTQVSKIKHSNGKTLKFNYQNGLLINAYSPNTNFSISYSYNTSNELTNVTKNINGQLISQTYEYASDGSHCLTKYINPESHQYNYNYATNDSGKMTGYSTGLYLQTNYYTHTVEYKNGADNITTVTYNRSGIDQTYTYTIDTTNNRITSIKGPGTQGTVTAYKFDNMGNRKQYTMIDPTCAETITVNRAYTTWGAVTNESFSYGNTSTYSRQYEWNPENMMPTAIIDQEGHRTEIEYTNDLPTKICAITGSNSWLQTSFAYTTNGLLSGVTNANNHWVHYNYDTNGYISGITPQTGPTITYSNSILGHIKSITLPGATGNRITSFDVNPLGWIKSITYPDNTTEEMGYDNMGNMTVHTNTDGSVTTFEYLPTRKLSKIVHTGWDGLCITNRFVYDNQFNSLNIIDALERNVEGYILDMQDRPVSVTNVENQTMSITYGVENYIKQITRFDGTVVANSYNGDGWLSEIRYPDSTNKYTYYKNGLLKTSGNELGTISNQYDGANRLIRVDSGNSWAEYSLDGIGNATNTTIGINSTVSLTNTYTFDAAERVSGINSTGGAFTYAYNPYNGLVSAVTNTTTGGHVEYSYDIMDRLQSIKWKDSSGNTIRSFDYAYNLSGMITNITLETGEEISYTYDTMQRLKSESSEVGDQRSDVSYSYDAVGNRLSKTVDGITVNYNYPYGTSGNRLASWAATSTNNFESLCTISVAGHSSEEIGTNDMFGVLWVSNTVAVTPEIDGTNFSVNNFIVGSGTQEIVAAIRDAAGNVGYATNTITTRIVTNAAYSYSDAGCLTNITYTGISYPKTTTSLKWNGLYQLTSVYTNGAVAESYQYDSLGRRTCSIRSQSGTTSTNCYIYDGIQCVADTDSSGNLLRSYTWGPDIDNLLAMTVYTGSVVRTYYALTDHLGTVHALTDSSGNIVESYKYDAWGRVLGIYDNGGNQLSESALGNRYLWQGREYSWSANLYYFRARFYDPVTGRFISKDPIGISGGMNQYMFCNNNGVNYTDFLGLWTFATGVTESGGLSAGATVTKGGWVISGKNTINPVKLIHSIQVGRYTTVGVAPGTYVGAGAAQVRDFIVSPVDNPHVIAGVTDAIGASGSIGFFNIGGELNVPINGDISSATLTLSMGGGVGTPEFHNFLSYTSVTTWSDLRNLIHFLFHKNNPYNKEK